MLIYILLLLPVPLILDFQLNLTSWSCQYLSNLFLKVFTDSALTTVGKGKFMKTIFHNIYKHMSHISVHPHYINILSK